MRVCLMARCRYVMLIVNLLTVNLLLFASVRSEVLL